MKIFSLCLLTVTPFLSAARPVMAQLAPLPSSPMLQTLKPTHPRLLASQSSWEAIKARRKEDATLDAFLKRGELEARALLDVPPIAYKKDGKRLLRVSRVVLRRVLLLGLHFQLTGDKALARRAEQEMLNASSFADWNPSHFLDVGEMTMALAFGYDWLSDELTPQAKKSIAAAIIKNGLQPGLKDSGWQTVNNNWNSVCLGGLALGALAIADEEPILASQILEKTKKFNPNGLKPYAPAGVYPEGANYWGYGTTFQCILLGSLESALGTDWNLSLSPGFLQTADAVLQLMGPTGSFFNFSDGSERPSLEGGDYWFAQKLNRPDLVSFEKEKLRRYSDLKRPAQPNSEADRTLPLIALWWPSSTSAAVPPLYWYGKSTNPYASFRTSWTDPNAMFLSVKGGGASLSHAHMDAGSFVFESDGVRWASDLGMQDYLSLESKNIDLWNSKQDGGRWNVFRLNNFSHNTLTINGQLHRVEGLSQITHFSDDPKRTGAIIDLSPVFKGQASQVTRGISFAAGSHVLIRDEVEGLNAGDNLRFALLTKTDPTISQDGKQATLTEQGKKLQVRLLGIEAAKFEVIPVDTPTNDYDAPNPGMKLLVVNFNAPANGNLNYSVLLQPGSVEGEAKNSLAETALKDWPLPLTH
jgi:hypothetical protein